MDDRVVGVKLEFLVVTRDDERETIGAGGDNANEVEDVTTDDAAAAAVADNSD